MARHQISLEADESGEIQPAIPDRGLPDLTKSDIPAQSYHTIRRGAPNPRCVDCSVVHCRGVYAGQKTRCH